MGGRPRKPKELKIIEGTFRKDREPKNRPSFKSGIQHTAPSWLDAQGRREWRKIIGEIRAIGMGKTVDATALALYCDAVSRYRRLRELVETEGDSVPTVNGGVQRNPNSVAMREAAEYIHKAGQQFGFTPASRSKVDLSGPKDAEKPKSEIDKIMEEVSRL